MELLAVPGTTAAAPASPRVCAAAQRLLELVRARPTAAAEIPELAAFLRHRPPAVCDSTAYFMVEDGDAHSVQLAGDFNGWRGESTPLARVPRTDLWIAAVDLPLAARVDYKYVIDGTWRLDAGNPRRITGGFGPNSELAMPAYVEPPELVERAAIPSGELRELTVGSAALGARRQVTLYLPPVAPGGKQPARSLYVLDGGEYLGLASAATILDNLIAAGRLEPLVGVFVSPLDRNREYGLDATFIRFLCDELLPAVEAAGAPRAAAADRAILGASLGGLTAVYAAASRPQVFGVALSQSGAFGLRDGGIFEILRGADLSGVRIVLQTGTLHDTRAANRRLRDFLRGTACVLSYAEYPEGHSWGNWRGHLAAALQAAWPAPRF